MSPNASENGLPSRIAAMVRGPQSLREDIADEIADHLACHEEDEPAADPAAAHAAAVRAFGNAEQIARELRAIHLGDLIMFQKITIAALVVIVAGMAATAYFSYQSSRQTAAQFAQTAEKFDEMNQQLTTLVEIQRSIAPKEDTTPTSVRFRIHCGIAPNDEPAVGWAVQVRPNPMPPRTSNDRTYTTDVNGWIETEPLPFGQYFIHGHEPASEGVDSYGLAGFGMRAEAKATPTGIAEMRVTVASHYEHDVTVELPNALSWDPSLMNSAKIRFDVAGDPGSSSRGYSIDLFKSNRVTGLLPGKARAFLLIPHVQRAFSTGDRFGKPQWQDIEGAWYQTGEMSIPDTGGTVRVPIPLKPAETITGVVYDGARDKPLAQARLQLECHIGRRFKGDRSNVTGWYRSVQYLRTDANGRFLALTKGATELADADVDSQQKWAEHPTLTRVGVPWRTPGQDREEIAWLFPQAPIEVMNLADDSFFVAINASQIGTARVSLGDIDGLTASGRSVNGPITLELFKQTTGGMGGGRNVVVGCSWESSVECRPEATADIAVPTGTYSVRANLQTTEREAHQPDIERRCLYSWQTEVVIKPGEIAQLTLPIGDLKGWKAGPPEWHRAGETQPATAPSTGTSTLSPQKG